MGRCFSLLSEGSFVICFSQTALPGSPWFATPLILTHDYFSFHCGFTSLETQGHLESGSVQWKTLLAVYELPMCKANHLLLPQHTNMGFTHLFCPLQGGHVLCCSKFFFFSLFKSIIYSKDFRLRPLTGRLVITNHLAVTDYGGLFCYGKCGTDCLGDLMWPREFCI